MHLRTYIHTTGRKNASTDHSSVIFNVNTATGEIEDGTSNAHWFAPHLPYDVCMYVCMFEVVLCTDDMQLLHRIYFYMTSVPN